MSEKEPEPSGPDHTSNGQLLPHAVTLWRRYVAGESLPSNQLALLHAALQRDATFRQQVMDEQRVDHLLKLAAEDEAASHDFVARVLQQCHGQFTSPNPANLATEVLAEYKIEVSSTTTVPPLKSQRKASAWIWWGSAAGVLLSFSVLMATYRNEIIQLISTDQGANPDLPEQNSGSGIKSKSPTEGAPKHLPDLDLAIASQLNRQTNQEVSPKQEPSNSEPKSNVPEMKVPLATEQGQALASITGVKNLGDDPRWPVGKTLGAETLLLESGEIQLTMSSGVTIELFAPSLLKLTSENSLLLLSGELSVTVPRRANDFNFLTPSLTIANSGAVFDVAVRSDGTTEVEVRDGSIAVASRAQPIQQQWNLNADDTHQLTFYSPNWIDPLPATEVDPATPDLILANYPIASLARQQSGPASGVVSLDGRSMKFDDELVFATVRDRVFRGAQESPDEFGRVWGQFVDAMTQQPQPVGQVTVNGVDFSFDNFVEAVKTQQRVLAQVHPEQSTPKGSESPPSNVPPVPQRFRGNLMINGQFREFESVEEYQAALRELIGPAAGFGLFPIGN